MRQPKAPFRYVTPVQDATGTVALVYQQLSAEFGFRAPTLATLSPAPEAMAAVWSVLRESLLAGAAPRTDKEVVAAGVSLANRCPFCVDAHVTLLHATGAHALAETILRGEVPADPHHARLLAWARATRTPGAAALMTPPFPATQVPAFVGTALAFHLINRIVSTLLTPDLLPGKLQRSKAVRRVGGRAFARTVRRPVSPGASLALLGDPGPPPSWAAGAPVGTAFAAARAAAATGRALLSEPAAAVVLATLADWDGEHPPLDLRWLAGPLSSLSPADRPGARLALLVALAPYRVTGADVVDWRVIRPDDADLVRLVVFAAMAAVERHEAAIAAGCPRPVADHRV